MQRKHANEKTVSVKADEMCSLKKRNFFAERHCQTDITHFRVPCLI